MVMQESEKKRTFLDCARQDGLEIRELQTGLDMMMGHELTDVEGKFYYRGRIFKIRLEAKE